MTDSSMSVSESIINILRGLNTFDVFAAKDAVTSYPGNFTLVEQLLCDICEQRGQMELDGYRRQFCDRLSDGAAVLDLMRLVGTSLETQGLADDLRFRIIQYLHQLEDAWNYDKVCDLRHLSNNIIRNRDNEYVKSVWKDIRCADILPPADSENFLHLIDHIKDGALQSANPVLLARSMNQVSGQIYTAAKLAEIENSSNLPEAYNRLYRQVNETIFPSAQQPRHGSCQILIVIGQALHNLRMFEETQFYVWRMHQLFDNDEAWRQLGFANRIQLFQELVERNLAIRPAIEREVFARQNRINETGRLQYPKRLVLVPGDYPAAILVRRLLIAQNSNVVQSELGENANYSVVMIVIQQANLNNNSAPYRRSIMQRRPRTVTSPAYVQLTFKLPMNLIGISDDDLFEINNALCDDIAKAFNRAEENMNAFAQQLPDISGNFHPNPLF